jgi:hypothetical protein
MRRSDYFAHHEIRFHLWRCIEQHLSPNEHPSLARRDRPILKQIVQFFHHCPDLVSIAGE